MPILEKEQHIQVHPLLSNLNSRFGAEERRPTDKTVGGNVSKELEPPLPRISEVTPSKEDYSRGNERLWAQDTTGIIDMTTKEEHKITKFNGKATDDYNLWRIRAEIALKGQGIWSTLSAESCTQEVKDKASSILVSALGDNAFRVCSAKVSEPLEMLSLLDKRYASQRASSRISVLTSLYAKRYQDNQDMGRYIDEFESLFSQLDKMGSNVSVPETHKAPLLLASLGTSSPLESTVAALRLRDAEDLQWESITADLIQEYKRIKQSTSVGKKVLRLPRKCRLGKCHHEEHKGKKQNENHALSARNATVTCDFCGKDGHEADKCYLNPDSPQCRLPKKAQLSMKKLGSSSTSDSSKKNGKLVFGSLAVIRKGNKAKKLRKPMNLRHSTFLDSGASITMFKLIEEAKKSSYKPGSDDVVQLAAGKDYAKCTGHGTYSSQGLSLPESVHVPTLNDTLISVGQVCDNSQIIVFTAKEAVILKVTQFTVPEKDVVCVVPRDDKTGLYAFEKNHQALNATKPVGDLSLWHNRLVHINQETLKKLYKHAVDFPKLTGNLSPCHPCSLGKATKKSFNSNFKPAMYAGEVVHSDLAGPFPVSMDGAQYSCTFLDQYSRFTHVVGIQKKSDAVEASEDYKELSHVKKYFPKGVERIHSDGGGEYKNVDVNEHSETTPHTPQHNPFSERYNRTFADPIRSLLEQSGLSSKYWEYALDYVVYVKNRVLNRSIGCSPFEKLTGEKPTLRHARVLGCAAFVYEHEPKSKVHARAAPAIMLGCNDHGVYTVERLTDSKIINSVHVTFDESCFPKLELSESSSSGEGSNYSTESFSDESSDSQEFVRINEPIDLEFGSCGTEDDQTVDIQLRKSNRNTKKPDRYGYESMHHAKSVIRFPITTADEPTVRQAMNATRDEAELWRKAIYTELETLKTKGTWKLCGNLSGKISRIRSRGRKGEVILPTHVVLKVKRNENGLPIKFKARVVAGGNFQVPGQDFEGVYSPVIDFTLVLILLAATVQFKWIMQQVDVKAAFLNGNIDRETYVSHPGNLPPDMTKSVYYKLNKSLYGLHQSPLCWFAKLREVLTRDMKFEQLNSSGAAFIRKRGTKEQIIVLVYVDDLIFVGRYKRELDLAITKFLNTFEGSHEANPSWYLGIHFEFQNGNCKVTQTAYIRHLLIEYRLENVKTYTTPMSEKFYNELEASSSEPVLPDTRYRQLLGSLIHLSNHTRPDISTAVGILSQYSCAPNSYLMKQANRVFGYLKGTIDTGIVFRRSPKLTFEFYCDSDYAGDRSDRKSRTGWVGLFNDSAVTWTSNKQLCISSSTSEAEYIALSDCCRELKWIRLFLAEIGISQKSPTNLKNDNTSAESWANSTKSMKRAKHIDVRYNFARECIEAQHVNTIHVDGKENVADLFTKPLGKLLFTKYRIFMGLSRN